MIAVNKAVLELAIKSIKNSNNIVVEIENNDPFYVRRINSVNNLNKQQKIDWTDYEYLAIEANQTGNGERGEPTIINEDQVELSKTLAKDYSYNVLTSDMISLDRSLKDFRHDGCRNKTYYAELPSVSVIIVYHNEYLSVLLRTVHSVINRAPAQLLKEIILVDDFSSKSNLKQPLDNHIKYNFPYKVRVIRLEQRSGLMKARMAGIRNATGEIVVVMDAHVEVGTNWLPPLIEPIAEDYRTVTLAIVDYIDAETFEYRSSGADGYRGVLNWDMTYILLPRSWADKEHVWDNYENPIMLGAFFAINRNYFWELGGYDDQLEIWGAEQFELSFKVWMCGGRMLTVPCTRIGHNFKGKGPHPFMTTSDGKTYVWRNMKRVAEVWLDEYKDALYEKIPNIRDIEAGDLSKQIGIREKLRCKSFKWYLENIAPDILKTFPVKMPTDFAFGAIESIAVDNWCVDALNGNQQNRIGLFSCAENRINPHSNQNFVLSFFRDIRIRNDYRCWDANPLDIVNDRIPIKLGLCHTLQGNQFFRYDHINNKIYADNEGNRCLDVDFSDIAAPPELFVTTCNDTSLTQKFSWGYVNETCLMNWDSYGSELNYIDS
uniref:Polypeptide N-acetylgalactosaminyltransferase n=1 Tax=Culicoides sonorensis TaxID=179676 RepID=A0A336MXC8_CULSO